MNDITNINANKPPVTYYVTIEQHWDGRVTYTIENVVANGRSLESVAWALRQMADSIDRDLGKAPVAQPQGDLPPLPAHAGVMQADGRTCGGYTGQQMRDYARAALAGQQKEGIPDWRELTRRLYVELYHCDQQMTGTFDDDSEPLFFTGSTVREVLQDAKTALSAAPQQGTGGQQP